MRIRRADLVALSIAGIVVFFGAWWIAASNKHVNALILPTPAKVVTTFIFLTHHTFANFTIQQHLGSSLLRFLYGFVLAADIGIRTIPYTTSMLATIALWLTVAPAIGAVARGNRRPEASR